MSFALILSLHFRIRMSLRLRDICSKSLNSDLWVMCCYQNMIACLLSSVVETRHLGTATQSNLRILCAELNTDLRNAKLAWQNFSNLERYTHAITMLTCMFHND